MSDKPFEPKPHHIWQNFRRDCVELAIKSGAGPDNVVEKARVIHDFILTKSKQELQLETVTEASLDDGNE